MPAAPKSPLAALPATFASTPGCDGCLQVTLTLRPDGAYLVRERLGSSEFYDFGRWREGPDGRFSKAGAMRRGATRCCRPIRWTRSKAAGRRPRRQEKIETLRGPFRVVGLLRRRRVQANAAPASPGRWGTRAPGERLKQEFAGKQAGGSRWWSIDAPAGG